MAKDAGDVRRLGEIERGIDVGVENPVDLAFLAHSGGSNGRGRLRNGLLERGNVLRRGTLDGQDHGEGALDILVELVDQDAVGLG